MCKAFDICPANQLLNHISNELGLSYDEGGRIARSGRVNKVLLDKFDQDPYYQITGPRSLSNQNVLNSFVRLLDSFNDTPANKLRTAVTHIASRIAGSVKHFPEGKLLITGGGAHNNFLVKMIGEISGHRTVIPDSQIVNFKEALIFAFMGVLKIRNEVNCLSSVTGAKQDNIGGIIFYP